MTSRELRELWLRQTDTEAALGAPIPLPVPPFLPAQRSRAAAPDDLAG
jgi:hypothetical protein